MEKPDLSPLTNSNLEQQRKPRWYRRHVALFVAAAVWCTGALAEDGQGRITLIVVGDALITQPLSTVDDQDVQSVVERIQRADLAIANLETVLHDYEPAPAPSSHGVHMRSPPETADELSWAGFDMVSRANNHAGDYGSEGLILTSRYLDQAGLVHAGVGANLEEARQPAFVEIDGVRVALISMASTFPEHAVASTAMGGFQARPGLNPLRYTRKCTLPLGVFSSLRMALQTIGLSRITAQSEVKFGDTLIEPGSELRLVSEPHLGDLAAIESVIRSTESAADLTVVALHAHTQGKDVEIPAEFIRTFARQAIDAGADIVVVHGPHVLRGIEVYQTRPILYSVGNFIEQVLSVVRFPPETFAMYGLAPDASRAELESALEPTYYGFGGGHLRSVLAELVWEAGEPIQLRLVPVVIGRDDGWPRLADAETGQAILRHIEMLSAPYGSDFRFEDGEAVIQLLGVPGDAAAKAAQ